MQKSRHAGGYLYRQILLSIISQKRGSYFGGKFLRLTKPVFCEIVSPY